jgi:hypothetical protein
MFFVAPQTPQRGCASYLTMWFRLKIRIALFTLALGLASVPFIETLSGPAVTLPEVQSGEVLLVYPRERDRIPLGGGGDGGAQDYGFFRETYSFTNRTGKPLYMAYDYAADSHEHAVVPYSLNCPGRKDYSFDGNNLIDSLSIVPAGEEIKFSVLMPAANDGCMLAVTYCATERAADLLNNKGAKLTAREKAYVAKQCEKVTYRGD